MTAGVTDSIGWTCRDADQTLVSNMLLALIVRKLRALQKHADPGRNIK